MALPDRPSLEYLKKLAKDRLLELRRADAGARLADAQLAVAREHGFPSGPSSSPRSYMAARGAPAVVVLRLAAGADPTVRDPVLGCTPEAFGICTAASWAWLSKARQRLAENPALARGCRWRSG